MYNTNFFIISVVLRVSVWLIKSNIHSHIYLNRIILLYTQLIQLLLYGLYLSKKRWKFIRGKFHRTMLKRITPNFICQGEWKYSFWIMHKSFGLLCNLLWSFFACKEGQNERMKSFLTCNATCQSVPVSTKGPPSVCLDNFSVNADASFDHTWPKIVLCSLFIFKVSTNRLTRSVGFNLK